MKKIALILFTALYLIPAIGFSINVHWCGNNVSSVNLESFSKSGCSCGIEMPLGCCKDIKTVIKFSDTHSPASQTAITSNELVNQLADAILTVCYSNYKKETITNFSDYHAPPFKCKLPVYMSICVFRI